MVREKKESNKEKMKRESSGGIVDTSHGIWQDDRFKHLVSDPRFRTLPKVERKVKIDKRFQQMFTNDRFKVKYTVDKYGRRINSSTNEDLRKFYELESSEEEEENDKDESLHKKDQCEESDEEEIEERLKEEKAILTDNDDEEDEKEEKKPSGSGRNLLDPDIDYARGEGRLLTDSSDDESSEDGDVEEISQIDHVWGELDQDAETTDQSTRRLAACNMNWDRIRAVDLMVLFSSFLPHGSSILSVKIYPSEFGKQRLKEEEVQGPQELVNNNKKPFSIDKAEGEASEEDDGDERFDVEEQDSDMEEGDFYHMEKLRQYQLNRLRYYYAVIVCDKVSTADKIYKECDGLEYESSATRIDLRFIPDEEEFEESDVVDECIELPDISQYKPRQFTTSALQQVKVDLTWDETAIERKELGEKLSAGKLEAISDRDLRKIVSYSSEEEESEKSSDDEKEEDDEEKAQETGGESNVEKTNGKGSKKLDSIMKYKALLAEINENEKKEKDQKRYEMEFTWDMDAEQQTTTNATSNDGNDDKNDTTNGKKVEMMTPIEKVLQKRLEKNRKRKEERRRKKLMSLGKESNDSDDDDEDEIDMNDPYFAEEFANGDYIDPAASKRKERKERAEQQKRQEEEEEMQKAKELQLLLDNDDNRQHFSLAKILKSEQGLSKSKLKKLKKRQQLLDDDHVPDRQLVDDFKMNVYDERFAAIYNSFDHNIDPSDSHFKKTKGMEQLIQEKLKRRNAADAENLSANEFNSHPEKKRPRKEIEQSLLVKSLKNKLGSSSTSLK